MRRGRERDEITTMDGPWLRQTDPLDPSSTACLDRLRCRMGDHHPNGSGRPLSMVLQGTWSVRLSGCFESLWGRLGGGYPCRVLTSSALIAPGRRLFSAPTAGDLFYTFGDGSPTLHHSSAASLRVSLSAEVLASHQATSGHGQALNKHLALHGKRAAPSSSLWLARDGRCDSSQSKRVTVG